ncbi:hypothetical protein SAMN05421507_1446 [Lentzea jiangxiensis]|uniref:Uncharacterized protein n=1 Tax=Lentzea jiangxiensis TaxID=641025 RepID=A0A1H0X7W6_9PSEU|nr:hypothetical protein SAMN05421507_1446 [Lentzea jiangxiensis]
MLRQRRSKATTSERTGQIAHRKKRRSAGRSSPTSDWISRSCTTSSSAASTGSDNSRPGHQIRKRDTCHRVKIVGDRVVLRLRGGPQNPPWYADDHSHLYAQGVQASWQHTATGSTPFQPVKTGGQRAELGNVQLSPQAKTAESCDAPTRLSIRLQHPPSSAAHTGSACCSACGSAWRYHMSCAMVKPCQSNLHDRRFAYSAQRSSPPSRRSPHPLPRKPQIPASTATNMFSIKSSMRRSATTGGQTAMAQPMDIGKSQKFMMSKKIGSGSKSVKTDCDPKPTGIIPNGRASSTFLSASWPTRPGRAGLQTAGGLGCYSDCPTTIARNKFWLGPAASMRDRAIPTFRSRHRSRNRTPRQQAAETWNFRQLCTNLGKLSAGADARKSRSKHVDSDGGQLVPRCSSVPELTTASRLSRLVVLR